MDKEHAQVGITTAGYPPQDTGVGRMVRDPELLASLDFLNGVENFDGEVLFLSSEYNKVYGADYQKRHLKYYKNAIAKVVPNTGHHIFIDQPELSNKMIDEFFMGNTERNKFARQLKPRLKRILRNFSLRQSQNWIAL